VLCININLNKLIKVRRGGGGITGVGVVGQPEEMKRKWKQQQAERSL
jgi:hypothetical protein